MSSVITIEVIQKEFIQEITLKKDELSRHLKNAEINLKKAIQKQCHREIIARNKDNIHKMKEQVEDYEIQLRQINENDLEMKEQIEEKYTQRLEKHTVEQIKFERKMKKKTEKKKTEKKVLKGFFNGERKIRYAIKTQKRNMRYGYKHFCRTENSLPDYMRRNLKNMPNNKGYIWKSIHYYGLKPAIENEPTFLFEKRYGTLYIHEYTHNEYFYFSKEKDGPKVLIKHEKRIPVFPEFTKPVVRQQDSRNRRNNNDRRNNNNYRRNNNNDRRNNNNVRRNNNNNDRRNNNNDRRNNNNNDRRNNNNDRRNNNDRNNNDRNNNDRNNNNDRRNNNDDRRNNNDDRRNNNNDGNKTSSWTIKTRRRKYNKK